MIGQTIIGATEIKSLVFNSCPEIPLAGDEEAMRVTKIIIERGAVTKIAVDVVEIAAKRVVHLIIEQIKVIFFRLCGLGLILECWCACDSLGGGTVILDD